MLNRIGLAGLVTASLVILLPSFALADDVNFGVVPAEVRIDNLRPGETEEFELAIHNNDAVPRSFTLATFPPPAGQERQGATQFPDGTWIDFSSDEIEIPPYDQADVTVRVAIPREQEWVSQDWETWLGVTAQSSDLLCVKLYVRVLVSTGSILASRFNTRFFIGVGLAAALIGCGGVYYFRRRARFE
jgi:hypothetical protein